MITYVIHDDDNNDDDDVNDNIFMNLFMIIYIQPYMHTVQPSNHTYIIIVVYRKIDTIQSYSTTQ